MSEQIKDIMNALDTNIKFLEEGEEINMNDVKGLMIDVLGILKDLWEKLGNIFLKAEEIKVIEKASSEEKKYEKKEIKDPEIKRFFI